MHLFGWLTPGEVKLYGLDGLEDAKTWVGGVGPVGRLAGRRDGFCPDCGRIPGFSLRG